MNERRPAVAGALWLALCITASAAADELDPCAVLTLAEVRAAFGEQWKQNEAFSSGEYCAYQGSPTAVVTLILTQDARGADATLAGRKQMAGDKAKPAPGPGSGAYHVVTPNAIALVFGKGEYVGQLEATPAATKDWAALDRLAKAAHDRLP